MNKQLYREVHMLDMLHIRVDLIQDYFMWK